MSLIGLIMLMGLVTKNAILLVDFTKVLRGRGLDRREAIIQAGRTRLRPIIMTTSAMIFGMLPLALGLGAGGEMRAPMARAVIGGLITSTLLTLIVVPVVYTLLDDVSGVAGPAARRTPSPRRGRDDGGRARWRCRSARAWRPRSRAQELPQPSRRHAHPRAGARLAAREQPRRGEGAAVPGLGAAASTSRSGRRRCRR